jgi:hypothetical protein
VWSGEGREEERARKDGLLALDAVQVKDEGLLKQGDAVDDSGEGGWREGERRSTMEAKGRHLGS